MRKKRCLFSAVTVHFRPSISLQIKDFFHLEERGKKALRKKEAKSHLGEFSGQGRKKR